MRRRGRRGLWALLRPIATPVLVGFTAMALLCGVGVVALHESDQALQRDAQERIESNRDSAIRAISRQATDLMRSIETYAGTPAVIDGLNPGWPGHCRGADGAARPQQGRAGGDPVEPQGRQRRDRAAAARPARPELRLPRLVQGRAADRKALRSSAYRSVAPGNPLVVGVSTPVFRGNTRVGYLDHPRAARAGARRRRGRPPGRRRRHHRHRPDRPAPDQRAPDRPRGEPTGTTNADATTQALDGEHHIVGEHDFASAGRVPGIGWTVTASLPTAIAMAPARVPQSLGLTLGAALLLVLLFAAVRSGPPAGGRSSTTWSRSSGSAHHAVRRLPHRHPRVRRRRRHGHRQRRAERDARLPARRAGRAARRKPSSRTSRRTSTPTCRRCSTATSSSTPASGQFRAKDGTLIPAHTSVIWCESRGDVRRLVAFVVDQREQKRVEDRRCAPARNG